MKITNNVQVDDLMTAVYKCEGDVLLKSKYGDVYNLKSTLSAYVAIAALLHDHNEDLELFCMSKNDEQFLFGFFNEHPEVLGKITVIDPANMYN